MGTLEDFILLWERLHKSTFQHIQISSLAGFHDLQILISWTPSKGRQLG